MALLFQVVVAGYLVALFCGAYHIGFRLPTTPLEFWIYLTGLASVWLAVKEHVWNWPVGLVNVALWVVLFLQQRLYGNAALQIVYIVTGLLGWYWWLHGGQARSALTVRRSPRLVFAAFIAATLALSLPAQRFLIFIGGSATFWDGITTLLSLAGQYFLMKKWLENWCFWIVADVIYVGLFLQQRLLLSAQLYAVFLLMCFFGVAEWRRTLRAQE